MRSVVRRCGDGGCVCIPRSVLAAARLCIGEVVDVSEQLGRVVIAPLRKQSYDLAALVAGITDENRHETVCWGPARGAEA